jgi:hypothetical protein
MFKEVKIMFVSGNSRFIIRIILPNNVYKVIYAPVEPKDTWLLVARVVNFIYLTVAFFKQDFPNIFLLERFQFPKLSIFQFSLLIKSIALSISPSRASHKILRNSLSPLEHGP